MHQFFIGSDQVWQDHATIRGKDVNHIRTVLRMKHGSQLLVTDGNETEYLCEIEEMDASEIRLGILEKRSAKRELPAEIFLYQALPKGDKMELVVEKAVELGVSTVIPVETKRCVVKLDEKKAAAKVRRWNAIAESAAKQSKRNRIPLVEEVMPFRDALAHAKICELACIPYESARGMQPLKTYLEALRPGVRAAFFIGPEGGFEEAEIQAATAQGIVPVSLGRRILRTETAGLALLSMMMLTLECQ